MPTTDLMLAIPPTGWRFGLRETNETSATRAGVIRVKQFGPDLFAGRLESDQLRRADARRLKALIAAMGGSRGTFYAWDCGGQYPADDPGGVRLGAAAVQINSVAVGTGSISLKGLPAGYTLRPGDYLAFDAGGKRALHTIVAPLVVTASAGGITPTFTVAPTIRAGATVGLAVRLVKAAAEMMIVPGSLDIAERPRAASIVLDAIQVI